MGADSVDEMTAPVTTGTPFAEEKTATDQQPAAEVLFPEEARAAADIPAHSTPDAAEQPSSSVATDAIQPVLMELAALRRDFEAKLLHDGSKQRQLDVMHEELQAYRNDLRFQILQPLFMDLVMMYSDLSRMAAAPTVQSSEAPTSGDASTITHQLDLIEQALIRHGVEIYRSSDATFDRSRQRVIAMVDTIDPTLDQRVAERVRPGFLYEGKRVLQAEQVKTYRYIPSAPVVQQG